MHQLPGRVRLTAKEKNGFFSIIRSSKIAIFAILNLAYLARFFFICAKRR